MGEICLNALPLVIAADADTVIGRVWDRNKKFDDELREQQEHGDFFQHYSVNTKSYAWAWPGGELPLECASRGKELKLGDTPARVVAYASRRAAARRLEEQGFELCSARLGQPIRLSRRKSNLAEGVVGGKLQAEVGAFAALSVQGFAVGGDDTVPGQVALIIGQWIEHVLDVELSALESNGVDLVDARVRWRHQLECSCDRTARVGDAGRVLDTSTNGDLKVRDLGGEDVQLPGRCLAVHANKRMLTRYLAGLTKKPDRSISEGLRDAVQALAATDKRWKNLENTSRQLFGQLELFDGVTAKVSTPLVVPAAAKANGSGPVVLPALAEGELNFGYGTQKLSKRPQFGLKDHGPYDEGQHRTDGLRAVVVAPEQFKAEAKRLKDILTQGVAASKIPLCQRLVRRSPSGNQ